MRFWRLPWQRSIGPVGLDLGGDMPRAMQIRQGSDLPTAAICIPCERTATLVERAQLAARAMKRAGFVGREVAVGLPSGIARMHVARLPVLEGADRCEAIAWEASERTGIARESVVADAIATDAPSAAADGREEHLVVSAEAALLTQSLEVLLAAGFDPIAAEPRFASLARALARRTRRDADASVVRAVLHVDEEESTVMVLRGDRIAFCREIPSGGAALDGAVAARLGISLEAAHALRNRRMAAIRGIANPIDSVMEEPALAAARATLDALAGELALCLRYFGVTFRGGQPARVVLSGPNAMEPRLAGIVEETCRASVVGFDAELGGRADALAKIAMEADECDDADTGAWLAAYGLACRMRSSAVRRAEPTLGRNAA